MEKSNATLTKPAKVSGGERPETGQDVRFSVLLDEKNAFRESFAALRKTLGLDQKTAAELVQVAERTVRRWESGTAEPPEIVQRTALDALRRGRKAPSKRRLDALAKSHHLHWEEHKGWMLRLTINVGSKIVGKRVKVRLRTYALEEAKKRRELVIASYRTLGIKVQPRVQRRGGSAN